MTDEGRPDDPDAPEVEGTTRSEGVRIIGAQEAAEAASRPDVARRRRRGEKRFGDRPDEPTDVGDLPKIRISTSDAAGVDAPTVAEPEPAAPRWADDGFAAVPDPGTERVGHARLLDEEVDVVDGELPSDDELIETDVVEERNVPAEPLAAADPDPYAEPAAGPAGSFGPGSWSSITLPEEPSEEEWTRAPAEGSWLDDLSGPEAAPESRPSWSDEPSRDEPSRDEPSGDETFRDDPYRPAAQPADSVGTAAGEGGFGAEDDSFVLPHWTEPPTGQVPKVVSGEEQPLEPMTGSQPRWRDEGDRSVDTDFDDLRDDGPRLGALGSDERGDRAADDFFDRGADEGDPFAAFAPDEAPVERAPRRRGGGGRRPSDGGDGGRPRRPRPEGGGGASGGAAGGDRNLGTAVAVGVGLAVLGLVCFRLGGLATTLLACVVVGIAAFEYFGAVQQRGYQPATLVGLVSIIGLLLATYTSGLAAYPVVLGLTVMLGLVWYLWVAPGENSVRNLGITFVGVLWIGFLGSFATLFLGLGKVLQDADPKLTSNPGIGVVIAAVIVAVSHDVGAYFTGRFFGRTPMSSVSPNKTLEGLAGGFGAAFVVTVVVVGFFGIHPIGGNIFRTIVFALLCAAAAPLGDLCESFIKRDLDLKDMGSVLPGHGGVLDRFDALLFVLPTAYFVTVLFDVWGKAA
ncbi:MAG: phosphatidate cytidylyltransferase [Microthrixaceae bacterium]